MLQLLEIVLEIPSIFVEAISNTSANCIIPRAVASDVVSHGHAAYNDLCPRNVNTESPLIFRRIRVL